MISLKNWNKPASQTLITIAGVVGTLTAYQDEVLGILHDAPFPVSTEIDLWVKWLLKASTTFLTILVVFTKKQSTNDTPTN